MKNILRTIYFIGLGIAAIILFQACGEKQNTQVVSQAAIQTPVSKAPASATPKSNKQELVAEDVDSPEVQAAIAYITLDEYIDKVSMRHNKPLFVNFWATWCGPCIVEMPHIVELYGKYRNHVDFLSVSCDSFSDSVREVPGAIQTLKMAFMTRVLNADDPNKAISTIHGTWQGSLPATFIYNTKGEKIKVLMGGQSKETFEAAIQEALESVVKIKLD